jgi:hypothetical protein
MIQKGPFRGRQCSAGQVKISMAVVNSSSCFSAKLRAFARSPNPCRRMANKALLCQVSRGETEFYCLRQLFGWRISPSGACRHLSMTDEPSMTHEAIGLEKFGRSLRVDFDTGIEIESLLLG